MTPAEQARLLVRKAAQDLAALERLLGDPAIEAATLGFHAQQAAEKLLKTLLAVGGHNYPRSHDIDLLLDLLADVGVQLPEELLAVDSLTPFATVYRYEDLPLEEEPDPQAWPQLLRSLEGYVIRSIEAAEAPPPQP
jgi:HEPN domain-containing protein